MSPRGLLGGLSRGMQVFLLVDVVLVLLMVVLLVTLQGRGDRGAPSAAVPAVTTPEATSDAGDGQEEGGSGDVVAFALPSGNIACEMSAEGVLCTIGSFTYAPPQVTGCEAGTGHAVRLDADGFGFVCEDAGTVRVDAGGRELPYGERERVGDYTCASGTDGVTCTDAAGVGFRLARAQWASLP